MESVVVTAGPFGSGSRLNRQGLLDLVKRDGVTQAGHYSVVVVLSSPPDGIRRAAFLISRRFDLLAVHRNRARRLFRESWRLLYPRLSPCWVLLIPRKAIKHVKQPQVQAELEQSLTRCGVCHPSSCDGTARLT